MDLRQDLRINMYDGLNFLVADWADEIIRIQTFATEHEDELRLCERNCIFPIEIYKEMGRRGWIGPFASKDIGGLGGGVAEYCAIEEEVGRTGLVSPQISIQGQRWLLDWGTELQKEKYLGPIARGELIFSESISEPGIGSSLKLMKTTAVKDGGDYLISGAKTHVNLGSQSDVTLIYAIAEEGLTGFFVDMSMPGVSSKQTDPIGLRLLPTADMFFDEVRVSKESVLGEVGHGMDTFLSTFNVSRLGNASELIGFARRAMTEAIDYGKKRQVGNQNVVDFQGIQWAVSEMYSRTYAASLVRNRAANLIDQGKEHALMTTLAKKLSIDAAEYTTSQVFSLIGGYGLYTNTAFMRLVNDTKVLRIAGGSLEILANYIARRVLKSETLEGLR